VFSVQQPLPGLQSGYQLLLLEQRDSIPCDCFQMLFPIPRFPHQTPDDWQRSGPYPPVRCVSLSNFPYRIELFAGNGAEFQSQAEWHAADLTGSVSHLDDYPGADLTGLICGQAGHCDLFDHFGDCHAAGGGHSSVSCAADCSSAHPGHSGSGADCLWSAYHHAAQTPGPFSSQQIHCD
jgi:hypothetical protein